MSAKNRMKGSESGPKKGKKQKSGPKLSLPKMDARWAKISGIALLCLSVMSILSVCSYLFTYQADQSLVLFGQGEALLDTEAEARNSLSRFGAIAGHFLVQQLFGLPSLVLLLLMGSIGLNLLMSRKLVPVGRIAPTAMLAMLVTSMFLAYLQYLLFPASGFFWGGIFGHSIAGPEGWLTGLISPVGTGILFFFGSLALVTWYIDPDFNRLLSFVLPKQPQLADTDGGSISMEDTIFEKDGIELADEVDDALEQAAEKAVEDEHTAVDEPSASEAETTIIEPKHEAETAAEAGSGIELDTATPEPEMPEAEGANGPSLEVAAIEAEKTKAESEAEGPELTVEAVKEEKTAGDVSRQEPFDPTLELSNFKFPELELLDAHGSGEIRMDTEELERNKNQIVTTLDNYNIKISKIKATIGPTVTLYEIVPAPGVRISKIKNLEDDIALSLAALGIRIIAPIPGKGTIGIEVPNATKEIVSMRSLVQSEKFAKAKMELPVVLGKTISNEIFVYDLAKMPHMLMAGATGQGKSVGINALIVSLLYQKHPSELKFVLVDPKKVELSIYQRIERHYLAMLPGEEEPIITDTKKVIATLNSLCIEMDARYELLKTAGTRNIKEYNQKFRNRKLNPENGHRFLPYIVLVIDEFADLIMTAGKEVETPIARLAQLARAIGIHLILATQRPSVNIITGVIKANFPARVSFKVTSKVDSRTILDAGGADQLIGRGDMLFSTGADLTRIQCGFVDTPEVEKIVCHIQDQQGFSSPMLLPEVPSEGGEGGGDFNANDLDPLFEEAAKLIVAHQMGSTSLIQRRLKLGYNRAGRLMDQLEQVGIVGPNAGSKAREVLVKTDMELEQFLETYR